MNMKKILALILLASLATTSLGGCKKMNESPESALPQVSSEASSEESNEPEIPANLNPLTGVADLPENMIGKRPVSFIINNAKQAWPQCGISQADIVYEWPYEGTSTRLMAVFSDWTKAPTIGPLRSVRHDFVELSLPLNTIFVNWGSSVPGQQAIANYAVDNLDGMGSGPAFFRDQARRNQGVHLEHTAMIDTEKMVQMIEKAQFETDQKLEPVYPFHTEETPVTFADTAAKEISVKASSSVNCIYRYDEATQKYTKYEFDQQQVDANNNAPVQLDNVFLLYANITAYNNDPSVVWRDLHLEEGGSGYYITRGTKTPIKWSKPSANDPITYTQESGEALSVNIGNSWVMFTENGFSDQTVFS